MYLCQNFLTFIQNNDIISLVRMQFLTNSHKLYFLADAYTANKRKHCKFYFLRLYVLKKEIRKMKYKFNIADISVSAEGDIPQDYLINMEPYSAYSEEDMLQIRFSIDRHIPVKKADRVYGVRRFIEEYGSLGEYFITQDISGNESFATFLYSHDFRQAEFSLVDVEQTGGNDLKSRFNIALGKCVLNCLPIFGGMTFHSSAISYKGNAILFAAPSGTGKSTQSRLWKRYYPKETFYINDDTPIIRKKDGKFFAYGSPWAGTSGINSNISAPVRAIVYIERSKVNSVQPVEGIDKLLCGMRSVREQVFPPQRKRQNELMLEFMEEIPVYKLHCDMSQEAVEILKSLLFAYQ